MSSASSRRWTTESPRSRAATISGFEAARRTNNDDAASATLRESARDDAAPRDSSRSVISALHSDRSPRIQDQQKRCDSAHSDSPIPMKWTRFLLSTPLTVRPASRSARQQRQFLGSSWLGEPSCCRDICLRCRDRGPARSRAPPAAHRSAHAARSLQRRFTLQPTRCGADDAVAVGEE